MISNKSMYKLIRYVAQGIVLFLLIAYFPVIKMQKKYAVITTLIILLLCLLFEQCYVHFRSSKNMLDMLSCGGKCDIEKFENKKCRIVCDDDTQKETEKETKNEKKIEPMEVIETHETPNKPANDDRLYWGSRYGNLGYDNRYGFGGMFYDEYPFYNRFRNNDLSALKNTKLRAYREYLARERKENEDIDQRLEAIENRAHDIGDFDNIYQEGGFLSEKRRAHEGRGEQNDRVIKGTLENELPYTDYNHLPVGAGYKSHKYEYGYSFLPPEKWYPQPPRPPVCVTNRRCPVAPSFAQGTPVDVKEFHSARRITPPDIISTEYIRDKLNAGR